MTENKHCCPVCCEEDVPAAQMWSCASCGQQACGDCFKHNVMRPEVRDLVCISRLKCPVPFSDTFRVLPDEESRKEVALALAQGMFDQQSAQFPAIAQAIANQQRSTQYDQQITKLTQEIDELEKKVKECQTLRSALKARKNAFIRGENPDLAAADGLAGGEASAKRPRLAQKVMMLCPYADCNGLVERVEGEKCRCVSCGRHCCPDCLEKMSAGADLSSHTCDEDKKKSEDWIRESCKPCPQCKSPIFKTGGCDHMFCTSCKKTFSYRTGKTIQNAFGNPHFDAYIRTLPEDERAAFMRELNRGQADRWCEDNSAGVRDFSRRLGMANVEFDAVVSDQDRAFFHVVQSVLTHHFNSRARADNTATHQKQADYFAKKNRDYILNKISKDHYLNLLTKKIIVMRMDEEIEAAIHNFTTAARRVVLSRFDGGESSQHPWYAGRSVTKVNVTPETVNVLVDLYAACFKDILAVLAVKGSNLMHPLRMNKRAESTDVAVKAAQAVVGRHPTLALNVVSG